MGSESVISMDAFRPSSMMMITNGMTRFVSSSSNSVTSSVFVSDEQSSSYHPLKQKHRVWFSPQSKSHTPLPLHMRTSPSSSSCAPHPPLPTLAERATL